jgi:CHAD domain-containing protein
VKQKPEKSIRIYAGGLLLSQLATMTTEVAGVRAARDMEAVHRTRVSSRRLRAILEVFQDCLPVKRGILWQQGIRKLTGALGAARDTDVQIISIEEMYKNLPDPSMRPGIRRLLLRLKQQRSRLQIRLLTRLDEYEASGVAEEIRAAYDGTMMKNSDVYLYTPELYKRSFEKIQAAFENFNSFEEKIQDPANIKELHAMRIAGKNLRYVMECFSSIYSNELKGPLNVMKEAQELLGNIHDCDVWILQLPDFLETEQKKTQAYFGRDRYAGRFEPGINFLLTNKQENRDLFYKMYMEKWNQWKAEKVWENLFHLLQVPFFNKNEIMPLSLIEQVRNGGIQ